MRVYQGIDDFKRLENAVVTSGFFDGVHIGHQKVLSRVTRLAKEIKGESVVITFWPHPKAVLNQSEEVKVLSSLEEKIELIAFCEIDHLIIIPFTKDLSQLSSEEFIKKILIEKIGVKKLVIGYDHRFGRNREGSFEYLKQHAPSFGFEVEEIAREDVNDMVVSSTRIRNAVVEGKTSEVIKYLGRPYSISGIVVEGKKLGRTIGYPTANIFPEAPQKIIPGDGIYAVKVVVNHMTYKGMLSIGYNPTVDGKTKTIEVYIFDFNQNIYNQQIKVEFIEYLREEIKFDSLEELKLQLKKDEEVSLKILSQQ